VQSEIQIEDNHGPAAATHTFVTVFFGILGKKEKIPAKNQVSSGKFSLHDRRWQ
jgi:hypothetical protein